MNTYNRARIMKRVFDEMPAVFTSKEFCQRARELGLDEAAISSGGTALFLHKFCTKEHCARTWTKKSDSKISPENRNMSVAITKKENLRKDDGWGGKALIEAKPTITFESELTEEACVSFLKQKGYKVLKPKWDEV